MDGQSDYPEHGKMPPDGRVTAELAQRLAALPRSRLVETVSAGISGLHQLVSVLRPSAHEFYAVVEFLTETGHHVDPRRQEWILLADLLGLSALIEDINNPRPKGATPNTIAGPFYRADVPEMALGADISKDGKGERLQVTGRVTGLDGGAVGRAQVEVWQANAEGRYENQEPDLQPEFNLRGRFCTDDSGRFHFLSVKPRGYSLPCDGPAGRLMIALNLRPERPAHLHFRVSAEGFETLTTHIFDRADPAIGRDALFGVKPELLAELRALPPLAGRPRHALDLSLVLCPDRARETEPTGRK